jgi:hypothetical protein
MMNKIICTLTLFLVPLLTYGHHSFTEYNVDVIQELQGEVISISWRNPHIGISLRANNADGTEAVWSLEAQDVNSLGRRGIDGSLINVGDTVRVAGNVSMRRSNNMSISNLLLANGTELKVRGNPEPRWSNEDNIGFNQPTVEDALSVAGEGEGLFRVWMSARRGGFPAQLPLTPAARAAQVNWDAATDDLTMQCITSGMPAAMRLSPPHPIDLTEQGDNIVFRAELFDIVRTIHMNPQANAAEQSASALGYSAGRWEGGTLVIETTRVNWGFFDHLGSIPISEDIAMTERLTVSDDGNQMVYELTVSDSTTFTEPVTGRWTMNWRPDLVVEPYVCVAEGD